ncbi:MAG: ATP-binding protein [Hydrogenophaga sp.]|uniref:ATP-binding protein n=1 Tax=Hydrogenophaga sp. TaxID=1904254 RepID=UPI0025BC1FBA|nr:AAA family ATPase [Hydrogenophaga sp.]MBU7571855.1 ATP-binding protein [Hydrogenophaga sp.]
MTNTALPELHAASHATFPFTALVGHDALQRALLLAAIDPGMGGVLISGPRGTAKSTSARALAALLPQAPFVTLPLAASLEQLVGTLNLEDVLRDGQVRLAPGLVARAHGGVLYVDEVNLLPDALVDALLDVAASGVNTVERDGVSRQHAAQFVLVGTMNPEEGELRPQLLDRFGLSVALANPDDAAQRQAIVRARLAFDADPHALLAEHAAAQSRLVATLAAARAALAQLPWPDAVVQHAAHLALAAGVDGIRADLVMLRAARALAALEQRDHVGVADVDAVAELALAHRRAPDSATPPMSRPSHAPAGGQGAAAASNGTEPDGDWGALPPQPEAMASVKHTGAWPPKKA